jgi:RNA polymerase sigma-70 factor (ECF subfamily)
VISKNQSRVLNKIAQIFRVKSQIEYSRNKLYQGAYSWCHDRALAEDLVQDCLLKAVSSKSELKDLKYLDTWLFRILINTWHDYLKNQKNLENLDDYAFRSISDIENEYLSGELVSMVRKEISKLPIALREVLTLSDYSGFSYQQVGDILDIPMGTVMSRLYKARRTLERKLVETTQPKPSVQYLRKVK